MQGEAGGADDRAGPVGGLEGGARRRSLTPRARRPALLGWRAGMLALVAVATVAPSEERAPEIVVHVSDLPKSALHEFDFWTDRASPGGAMVGTPNTGDDLDPPPEDDPHVLLQVRVQRGIPYRCWIHMKVGRPKGKSQANLLYVQFTDAVDRGGQESLRPGTGSYLIARGSLREGWQWVGCDQRDLRPTGSHIYFRTTGQVTVRLQAGMEGVGFDQVVLSPTRFLNRSPSEAVVAKPLP